MSYYKIITYGCQMNVHESEKMSGIMDSLGYNKTDDDNQADVIIFNTCCVRDNAERRAIGNISSYKKLKKTRPSLILVIAGCMTEQKDVSDNIYKKYPYIDIIIGNHNKYDLKKAIESRIQNRKRYYELVEDYKAVNTELISRTSGVNAWVNIMYGCNNFCSYCIVPYVRGRERSRKKEDIIAEVMQCLNQGYKEITLLGQNVNSYGKDLYPDYGFAELLEEIANREIKFRLNYMTSHPKDFNRKVVDIIRKYDNITNYIHLPIQSGSNRILTLMNRKYLREQYLEIIDYIKQTIPYAGITTDIMVGFPDETEENFLDTLDIVNRVKYSNAFMFIYSPRKGTPAAEMEQLSEDVKNIRVRRLIDLQRKITKEQANALIDSVQEVLAEDNSPRFKGMLCGRTYNGRLVHFSHSNNRIGDFVKVRITKNISAALIGEAIEY